MDYITGASGFVGKHLIKRLSNYICLPHEVLDKVSLEPFENFYFLSSYGNHYHQTDINKTIKANTLDLVKIILQAINCKFKSFVYFSTSSVKLPVQTMYSRCKRASEEILMGFVDKFNVPILIIRPFSITGVGEQEHHLIPTLIRSCYTGKLVNFDPFPTHDFIDVEDVIEGILTLQGKKGIFELGTGKKYTNQEVLDLVEKITGKKAKINIVEGLRSYDTPNWFSNNFRARGFGWMPKKTLEQSIAEMVEDYERTAQKNN